MATPGARDGRNGHSYGEGWSKWPLLGRGMVKAATPGARDGHNDRSHGEGWSKWPLLR